MRYIMTSRCLEGYGIYSQWTVKIKDLRCSDDFRRTEVNQFAQIRLMLRSETWGRYIQGFQWSFDHFVGKRCDMVNSIIYVFKNKVLMTILVLWRAFKRVSEKNLDHVVFVTILTTLSIYIFWCFIVYFDYALQRRSQLPQKHLRWKVLHQ